MPVQKNRFACPIIALALLLVPTVGSAQTAETRGHYHFGASRVTWVNGVDSVHFGPSEPLLQNARITVQLIHANGFRDEDPAIAQVVDELRDLFRFEGYRLLAEATVLTEVPERGTRRLAQRIAGNPTATRSQADVFEVEVFVESTSVDDAMRFSVHLRDVTDPSSIPTVLDVGFTARQGQTVVLGSSKYDPNKPTLIVAFRMDMVED